MCNENRPLGAANAGAGKNEYDSSDSTTPRRGVKPRPARRITMAERIGLDLLYGPPRSHDQDGDESIGFLNLKGLTR